MDRIKEKYKGIERRNYPRLDKNRGFIFCRLENRNSEEIKESLINNISVGGLCFDTLEPIDPGGILECEIYQQIDSQKNIVISISAKVLVVWISEINDNADFGSNKHRLGLRLIKIFPTDKEKIAKYINERMSSRK